jgi:DNA-directed RNA polymerase subunit RPC12/RpoP
MIEFACTHCGKALQVADQYAGKQARCPGCSQIVAVPEPAKAQPSERVEMRTKTESEPPYKTPPKPSRKEFEDEQVIGDEVMPLPEDAPDEECRYFAKLKMLCGIGGIIAAIFCIAAGGMAAGIKGAGIAPLFLGLVAAFFCVVFAALGWIMFSYLAKIAVYLYSIDKRLKGK